MDESQPGIVAPPTLAGVGLRTSPAVTRVQTREIKSLREHGGGGVVEQRAWWGEVALEHPEWLVPTKRLKHEVSLGYQHLRDQYDLVEELLAAPAPHTLAVWKPVTLTYVADGTRLEGWLPWRLAVDVVGPPPNLQASKFAPVIKVGRTSEPLAIVPQNLAAFEGGDPAAGEVWILTGEQRFKVEAAASGELIYVRIYPLLEVHEETSVERTYTGQNPLREPRDIRLKER